MKVVIDAVIFQLQQGSPRGVSRIWFSVLPILFKQFPEVEFVIIHRAPSALESLSLPNLKHVNKYGTAFGAHLEGHMLNLVCRQESADAFLSTYYTFQYSRPSVVTLYDMIPEELGWDLSHPEWKMKRETIERGSAFVCISDSTRQAFRKFYEDVTVPDYLVSVDYCGVDPSLFHPMPEEQVRKFRQENGIDRPYFLMVGSRDLYKNGQVVSRAFSDFEIGGKASLVCLGGEDPLEHEKSVPSVKYLGWRNPDSSSSATAYSGASALLFPSFLEGFGLPVREAQACGCPVLAADVPVLREVGGEASAFYLSPHSPQAWSNAGMRLLEDPEVSRPLVKAGLERAKESTWDILANGLMQAMEKVSP